MYMYAYMYYIYICLFIFLYIFFHLSFHGNIEVGSIFGWIWEDSGTILVRKYTKS